MATNAHAARNLPSTACHWVTGKVSSSSMVPVRRSSAHRRIDTAGTRNRYSTGCSRKNGCRRSEEHTSELQSLMRISYAVFCLKKKKTTKKPYKITVIIVKTTNYNKISL